MSDPGRVCLGVVVGAHGIAGHVKVKTFTAAPRSVAAYGPVSDDSGRRFELRVVRELPGAVIAALAGVTDRDAAAALRGTRLHVARTALPAPEPEEFYHADLIGLAAVADDGRPLGRVRAVHDFGAGDLLEVAPAGGGRTLMLPFTREVVPVVDVAGGRVVVVPPPGLLEAAEEED